MTTAFPFTTHETVPDGATESARLLDNRIRELRSDLNAIFGIPDETLLTGPIGAMQADGTFAFTNPAIFKSVILLDSGEPNQAGEITRNGSRLRFHTGPSIEDVNFAPGTRMLFDMDAAPLGWVRDTNPVYNDTLVRFTGSLAREHVGSWVISGLSDFGHAHGLGAHVHYMNHNHDLSNHVHSEGEHAHNQSGDGSTFEFHAGRELAIANFQTGSADLGSTDGPNINLSGYSSLGDYTGGPNTVSDYGFAVIVSNGAWRPLHRDVIVCQKT